MGRVSHVNWVDWVIVAIAALFAVWGYMQGIIVGGLSLAGFALGAVVGARVAPLVLSGGSHSVYAPLFGLVGALLVGALLASLLEGLGMRVRFALRFPGLRTIDGVLGAVLTACIGLGIVWIVGAVTLSAATSPGLRRDLAHSVILRDLDKTLPPSGGILNALSRFDPLPSINGPSAQVPKPTKGILSAPAVRAAIPSVVRVLGTACGLGIEGSGWVAAPGLVVTNAHVVAGESDTGVQIGGHGSPLPAQVILFDPRNDVAVLRVRGLSERALPVAGSVNSGTSAAILGYPQDGPFKAEPGRVGITKPVLTDNAYGNGPILREITSLRGLVQPGNSGGPLVDSRGRVVAMAFAEITNPARGTGPGGFAVPTSVIRSELGKARAAHGSVSTDGCAA
ncbi:MAG TPA: MarP family serine protease [Solirubrobacteraceae bacterium]|nr:MarP family serine protease [Solirubrobacteraceae bacterium]